MILSCIIEHVKKQHRCARHDDAHFLRVAGFSASRPRSLLVLLLSCRSPLRMASKKSWMCHVSIAISHFSFRALRAPSFAAVPESCRIVRDLCRPRYATSYPVAMCTQAMEQIRVDSLSIGRPTGLDPDPVDTSQIRTERCEVQTQP